MKRRLFQAAFAAYIVLMLWLLFIRWRSVEVTDYFAQLTERVNLIPFSSIGGMLHSLRYNPYPRVLWVVIYNVGGNIIMFVPLGFFLRTLVPACRSFRRCMGTVAVIMTIVELTQLVTLRGFCEFDDVMLNLLGAAVGWLIAKKSGA